jgi:hypothetical protein
MDSAMNSASAFFSHRRSEERDSTGVSPWGFNGSCRWLLDKTKYFASLVDDENVILA